jgi:hypothetical protein
VGATRYGVRDPARNASIIDSPKSGTTPDEPAGLIPSRIGAAKGWAADRPRRLRAFEALKLEFVSTP